MYYSSISHSQIKVSIKNLAVVLFCFGLLLIKTLFLFKLNVGNVCCAILTIIDETRKLLECVSILNMSMIDHR